MGRPTLASVPVGYVELAAVPLDYAAPELLVDQPLHGREEPFPSHLVEDPVVREGIKQRQVALRIVDHPEAVAALLGSLEEARSLYLARLQR